MRMSGSAINWLYFRWKMGCNGCRGTALEEELVEVELEAVVLEQVLVVRRVVVGAVDRRIREVLDQQAPEHVAVAQIDRAVHGLHALFLQPLRAVSNRRFAAAWSLMHSKNPIPPVGCFSV